MNQQNRKRQLPESGEQQQKEDDNRPIVGVSDEWSFNWEEEENTNNNGNGNELKELKLKLAAVEVTNNIISNGSHLICR
jgi:hypothetical protein